MKLFNYTFENLMNLEIFIDKLDKENKTILIQVLCGNFESKELQNILDLLVKKLPMSSIIGASTAGEIVKGEISRNSILISFSIFDDVAVQTYYFPKSDFEYGMRAAREVIKEDTKACIIFSEALKSDSESFIKGFSSINSDLTIAGGNAGDNFLFYKTFVIHSNTIYYDGIVLATLNSHSLHVSTQYSLEWTAVGKEMSITKCDKNIIYEIDNKPVKEIFSHYLGEETIQNIPASAIEFPLVKVKDNVLIARSMVAKTDDDGFIFAGHFENGEKVKFAIGNVEEILNNASFLQKSIIKNPVEATYIYSCSVRDLFLKEQLNYEFSLIENIAPSVGFFTYGEFFHSKSKNHLLNITTTTLSLSEISKTNSDSKESIQVHKPSMLKSLTHLVNATQNELNESMISLNQYKLALDESSIISKTDKTGIITYTNDNFCQISGYSREELLGKKHNIVRHVDMPKEIFKDMWKTIKSGKIWHGTIKNLKKNGDAYFVKTVIVPIFDDNEGIKEYIATRTDVTELLNKDKIIKDSKIDKLTGIKNRNALFNILDTSDKSYSLLLINLNRFSEINNYFGYDIGDTILKEFSKKLGRILENHDIFRVSGDEFAILCTEGVYSVELKEKFIQILKKIEQNTFKIGNHDISVDITCGIASGKSTEINKLAHIALKEARETNVKAVFFNDNIMLEEKIKNNIEVINKIKLAIEYDRIIPFFQGIVENKSKKIMKYESLIRLIDIDGSIISPYFFLEHAKKAKLYDKLTHIMIQKTFETFKDLNYEFSINFTIQDILSKATRDILCEHLKKCTCRQNFILEIVESEGIENFEEVLLFIDKLKKQGCKIAIDDFGSGYSNFSYLTKLKVDYLKIDGSLVKNIDKDENQKNIIKSILFFANSQGIKTIAEFVENEDIYNELVKLGVDFSQGYLFSKPSKKLLIGK